MRKTNDNDDLFQKRGVFYFTRRVPSDIQAHYGRPRIVLSLRTKSRRTAAAKAASLAAHLDSDWMALRWRKQGDALTRFLIEPDRNPASLSSAPSITQAKAEYVTAKKAGRSITFIQGAERATRYLLEVCKDKPIDGYSRSEINALRDRLFERGLGRLSVKRIFSTLQAIVNFAAREHDVENLKAFSAVYLGEVEASASEKRKPIPPEALKSVQEECRSFDDQGRWLIALISDTGLRLSEACGLVIDDVSLEGANPHLKVRSHPWRRLKTASSERLVPLVGASRWAVSRAVASAEGQFVFPQYCSSDGVKANSASEALNKWLRTRVPEGCVIHSFRHSYRDRLRAVQCPADITDRLGGWTIDGVGQGYGDGYPVEVLSEWAEKIAA